MDTGWELGVSLYGLWICATSDIPSMAERTATANQVLGANADDSGRFNRSERVTGYAPGGHDISSATTGRVYPFYDRLRDDLQNILAESTTNLYDCADALLKIMNEYAATDQEAADTLKYKQDPQNNRTLAEYRFYDVTNRPPVTRAE